MATGNLRIGRAGLGRFAAVAIAAACYSRAFPPAELTAASWLAMVPLLLALRGASARRAFCLAALWAYLFTALVISWMVPTLHEHFGWSMLRSVGFLLAFSAVVTAPFYGAAFALYAIGCRRIDGVARPFLLAATLVAAEYARSHIGFRSPWTILGDAHYQSQNLRQLASLVGVWGVSFVVALGNAALAEIASAALDWRRGRSTDHSLRGLRVAACGAVIAAVWLFGVARQPKARPEGRRLELAAVQGNIVSSLRWLRSSASHVLHRYGGLTRDALLAPRGGELDLVVWPEYAIQTSLDDPVYGPPLRALARTGAPLLYGGPRSEVRAGVRHHFNSAFLLLGDGPVQHYDKRRLLPFSETRPLGRLAALEVRGGLAADHYTPGREPGLFALADDSLGVLICMEALYPELSRELARAGATLLVNLSNDGWYGGSGGAQQHLAQVVFRAIETGLPLLRATSTGISALVLPDGEIAAQLPLGERGVLRVSIPLGGASPTTYTRMGDAFAIACVLACLGAALWNPLAARTGLQRSAGLRAATPSASRSSPSCPEA